MCTQRTILILEKKQPPIRSPSSVYSPGSSTTTHLLELYHFIISELDNGKQLRFIFLDILKAFDRVWHPGIIHKLEKAGVKGKLLSWVGNYLEGRQQRVVVGGEKSSLRHITAGVHVPQGSILGPLFFILYVNDIVNELHINVRLYADDITLYLSYEDPQTAATEIETNLRAAQEWAKNWFINFNLQKTESLIFSRKRDVANPPVNFDSTQVKEVVSHKHLGVNLQRNARWSNHIQEIISRGNKRIDILRSLQHRLDRRSLEKLYISYIRPILEYCNIVWDNFQRVRQKILNPYN